MSFFRDFTLSKANLPTEIPFLNIDDLLLLPGMEVTVTIDQHEYLSLVDKALSSRERLIAIAPTENGQLITDVGCAGRITSFLETEDGEYIIGLSGICRFHIDDVRVCSDDYKVLTPVWFDFLDDLDLLSQKISNRAHLNYLTNDYFNMFHERSDINLNKIKGYSDQKLVSVLTANLNCDKKKSKELIEARDLNDFSKICQSFMELEVASAESRQYPKH